MKIKITVLVFFISMLLTGQVLAFDVGGLSYIVINANDVEVTGRASGNTATDIVIPDTVVDSGTTYGVTTIRYEAFQNNALTSVTIGNSVTIIGGAAFFNNPLTSVIIPGSVKTIGDSAFSFNMLTSVIIPDSVTSIGVEAFSFNMLTSVSIPDSVTTIGDSAFQNNALTSVTIGNSVTTIGAGAFNDNALTSVIIPDSVTTIGNSAFFNNDLTSLTIGNSVTTIGDYAFFHNALTSAAFEGDFGTFMLDMFDDNPTLAAITYCDGRTGWPQGFNNGSTNIVTTPITCLSDVDGLSYSVINATDVEVTGRVSGNTATVIVIPDTVVVSGTTYSVTTIGDRAFRENVLASVIIPDSVTTIGTRAFSSNDLTSVIIPDSVTSIGVEAFSFNMLTSVIIPDSVTIIGDSAFYDNYLTSAAFEGDFGAFMLDMFDDNPALATITYCDVQTSWPQGFNNGSTIVVTAPIVCVPPGC